MLKKIFVNVLIRLDIENIDFAQAFFSRWDFGIESNNNTYFLLM